MATKEELIKLIKDASVDEFNEVRTKDTVNLLDLSETDFSGYEMQDFDLSYTDLSGSDFTEANINNVNFSGSDLTSATFTRAVVKKCDFSETILAGTQFNSACVKESDFTDSDTSGTDFSDSDLTDSDFSSVENLYQCKFDSYTVWPDESNLPENFDTSYVEDLSSLKDDDDSYGNDFGY